MDEKFSKQLKQTSGKHLQPSECGKIEMNFAEFPLGFLSNRVPKGCNSFVVEYCERFRGEMVTRRLSVEPSVNYGFPVAKDREIVTACIQLTKKAGFPKCGRIPFSRYDFIEALRWNHGGEQYARVTKGLNKLKLTGYKWENSWFDNESKEWCDHTFSILDNVVIAKSDKPTGSNKNPRRASWFKWNEVVLASFAAGFLRDLDLDTYHSLGSLAAKEIYPLLLKNFHWADRLSYDLYEFAFQKLGMRGRSYEGNVTKVKDALELPIRDLVDHGITKPLSTSKRFIREPGGSWQIVFERPTTGRRKKKPVAISNLPSQPDATDVDLQKVVDSLARRKISEGAAIEFQEQYSLEQNPICRTGQWMSNDAKAKRSGFQTVGLHVH